MEIKQNKHNWRKRLLIGVATEGWIRYEWACARYGQVIPVNWEASGIDVNFTAMGYSIDDAYNLVTKKAIELGVDWILFIEDDVLIPNDLFIKMGDYINENKYPVVSGLYYIKASPTVPLIFRGRGNGAFTDFEIGDEVWCDGLPMGCLLIHTSILKWMWENAESYFAPEHLNVPNREEVHRVFETPARAFFDPSTGTFGRQMGTQDLFFFDRVLEKDVLKKTGWDEVAEKEFPFLCDTSIFCKHIDRNTGKQYP